MIIRTSADGKKRENDLSEILIVSVKNEHIFDEKEFGSVYQFLNDLSPLIQ